MAIIQSIKAGNTANQPESTTMTSTTMTSTEIINKKKIYLLGEIDSFYGVMNKQTEDYNHQTNQILNHANKMRFLFEKRIETLDFYLKRNPHDILQRLVGCPLSCMALDFDDENLIFEFSPRWSSNEDDELVKTVILRVNFPDYALSNPARYEVIYDQPVLQIVFAGLPAKGEPFFPFNS